MTRYSLLLLLYLASWSVMGQSGPPSAVVTAGDYFSISPGSFSWTLGEIMSETYAQPNGILTQGLQQPQGASPVLPNVYVTVPANGAINQNVTLTLTSIALAGAATYTIEINTDVNFGGTSIVRSGARSQSFTGLAYNTTYYTRVKTDLSPSYGKVNSFTTAPSEFFAYVTSPANHAVNILTSVNVSANTVVGATTYTIELNTAADFTGTSLTYTGTRTHLFTGLTYSQVYYTRVKTDLSSNWGPAGRYFTTISILSASYITAPANNATKVKWQLNVTANNIGASQYTIQLSPDPDFLANVIQNSGPTNILPFSGLLYDTKYYARVSTNMVSGWGPTRSFTTDNPINFSYVTNPANNATKVLWQLNITSNTVLGATQYTIRISPESDFSNGVIQRSGSTPAMAFTGLAFNTLYYAEVTTNLSPANVWGPLRSFTTGGPSDYSYITSPANGATNISWVVNLTSYNVPGATTYTMEVNTGSSFPPATAQVKTGARTMAFTLTPDVQYFVRVKTNLALSADDWGPMRSFTTGDAVSLAYLITPKDGGTGVPLSGNATANPVPGAKSYTIELNPDSGFNPATSYTLTGATRVIMFSALAPSTIYHARVSTSVAPGIWGPTTSFTTTNPAARDQVNWQGKDVEDPPIADGAVAVEAYPNPFADRLMLQVQTDEQRPMQVSIIDLTGRTIQTIVGMTNRPEYIGESMDAGMYILSVSFASESKTLKIVKTR